LDNVPRSGEVALVCLAIKRFGKARTIVAVTKVMMAEVDVIILLNTNVMEEVRERVEV